MNNINAINPKLNTMDNKDTRVAVGEEFFFMEDISLLIGEIMEVMLPPMVKLMIEILKINNPIMSITGFKIPARIIHVTIHTTNKIAL